MLSLMWSIFAFAIVGLCIYCSKQHITMSVPILVEINDSAYNRHANHSMVCWINPDIGMKGIESILRRLPSGCDELTPGIRTNTFVGHQFLIVNPDLTVDSPPKIITVTNGGDYVEIQGHQNYDSMRSFDVVVEWQRLLLIRQLIGTSVAVALGVALYLTAGGVKDTTTEAVGTKRATKASKLQELTPYETAVPRNAIKCYAVLTMVLNHYGHIFMREYTKLRPVFTTLADGGGSSHFFNWLVGYNLTDTQTSSNVMLLLAFVFLQLCLDLPFPITYETLLSITIIRCVLRWEVMRLDAATSRCWAADAHIMIHAIACGLLVLSDPFIGTEGLRFVNINGVMYAFAGRLFALRTADYSKMLLWLSAAAVLTLFGMWHNFRSTYANTNVRYVYAAVFVCLTLAHGALLAYRCDTKSALVLPKWVKFIAHYSLEIYVLHFVLFYVCYATDFYTTISSVFGYATNVKT